MVLQTIIDTNLQRMTIMDFVNFGMGLEERLHYLTLKQNELEKAGIEKRF